MIDTIIIHEKHDPYGDYDFRNTDEEEKEELCPKCLELIEECECDYYGKLEQVEEARIKAESAMSNLHKIDIEVRELNK